MSGQDIMLYYLLVILDQMAGVEAGGSESLDLLDKYEQQVYELRYKMLEVKIELLETEVKITRLSKDQTNHTIKQSEF